MLICPSFTSQKPVISTADRPMNSAMLSRPKNLVRRRVVNKLRRTAAIDRDSICSRCDSARRSDPTVSELLSESRSCCARAPSASRSSR